MRSVRCSSWSLRIRVPDFDHMRYALRYDDFQPTETECENVNSRQALARLLQAKHSNSSKARRNTAPR
jgi:hypothetical protein